jgi:NAD(P)-dependent dehydrogenase (short-subunit alcohol dehydrogenase family)
MSSAPDPRTALVTGASSGIGAAIAVAFGGLGFRVALGGRRSDRLEAVAKQVEAAGGRALAFRADVAVPAEIHAFFGAAESAFGPVGVAVANAGISIPGLLHELRVEDLERELATNLLHPMVLARRALPAMLERGSGDLVFVSSLNAVLPRTYQVGYTATKMGVEGLARVLAMELEGTGVRSIVVRPGPTLTEFARDWPPGLMQRILRSWKYWGVQRHLGWMQPESVARAVVAAVTAPPGTCFDVIQVMPEGPSEMQAPATGRSS